MSINGDRDRSNSCHGFLKSFLTAMLDINKTSYSCTNVVRTEGALSIHSSVGIGFFSINAIVYLDIFECIVHKSTEAAHIPFLLGAVDKVLLGQAHTLVGLQEMLTLQRSSSRECPTGPAHLLVLDGSYCTRSLGPPVNLLR